MQIDGKTMINLTLSVDNTNIILGALTGQPYERVVNVIADIQQQALAQISPAHAAKEESPQ